MTAKPTTAAPATGVPSIRENTPMQPIQAHNALIAGAVRRGDRDAEKAARRDQAAARIERFVESVTASAPPLTDAQAERIAAILRAGTR